MPALARSAPPGPWPSCESDLSNVLRLGELMALGWDATTEVFTPDPSHRLFGWRVCPVVGCGGEGRQSDGLCCTCALARRAEIDGDLATFCARGVDLSRRRAPGSCLVCRSPGHERPEVQNGLCISCNHLRRVRHQSVEAYVEGDERYPPALARPSLGRCPARTCHRLAAHLNGLCDAHYQLWRTSGFPDLDAFVRAGTPRHGDLTGRVIMTGLPAPAITEVLYGVQICLDAGRKLRPPALRAVVLHLRQAGAYRLADLDPSTLGDGPRRFLELVTRELRLLGSDANTEYAKDVWDLRIWGHCGRLSFVGGELLHKSGGATARPIMQSWLKEATKAWAADALTTRHPASARRMVAASGSWSEHLARRSDHGEHPEAIGRKDLEGFLAWLGRLEKSGRISADARVRIVRSIAELLRDARALGLTAPGAAMAGLPEEVAVRRGDVPRANQHDSEETGRALPEAVMAQLLDDEALALLESLSGPDVRAAIELQAGVGRRTGELCSLAYGCLAYDEHLDEDGERRHSPVLVHDMAKVLRRDFRLPIHEREVALILAQQARVRARFPHTPPEKLMLFPRPTKNPNGTTAIAPTQLQRAVKAWALALPRLDGPESGSGRSTPFPRALVVPYAFRHSFAQRHADAGTPVDTLKELMGHRIIRTTLCYFRVTTVRKRAAQDALGPLQLEATARRVRPGIAGLGESEALRDAVGQVAVPFGVCTEPTNVSAEGSSCPFRHRCFGCEYFRTDPSFQPELTDYLVQLLADRERLAGSSALTDWARRDAAPAEEEIDAVRRLVRANDEALTSLGDAERRDVEDAIATLRNERARLAMSFPVELRGLVHQRRPQLFPTIERSRLKEATHG